VDQKLFMKVSALPQNLWLDRHDRRDITTEHCDEIMTMDRQCRGQ
jgi:hypothetical protein